MAIVWPVGLPGNKHTLLMNQFVNLISALLNTIIDILERILEQLVLIANGVNRGAYSPASIELPEPPSQEPDPADRLHGAKYAANRIGVVDRTLYRLTERGMLPVHSYTLGMRQFLHSDIERCRRYYLGE